MLRSKPVRSLALLAFLATGCSGMLANTLAGSSTTYSSDDDPELVAAAVPFGLKTMEGVLVEVPEHRGLLTALAAGFVQYGYAFVAEEASKVADKNFEQAQALQQRSRKLFLRARGYALRGMDARYENWSARLRTDSEAALAEADQEDVPLLYWTAASWALAIGAADLDASTLADFPIVEAIARRALVLDETWNDGTLYEFLVSFESARPGAKLDTIMPHLERAVALSGGRRAGVFVSYAEGVCVKQQDADCFRSMLAKALAIDVDAHPAERLANVIMQRKAKRLLAVAGDLILGADEGETP